MVGAPAGCRRRSSSSSIRRRIACSSPRPPSADVAEPIGWHLKFTIGAELTEIESEVWEALDTAAEKLVDPRVAKHGGTRSDRKRNYDFPGMVDAASWRRTQIHRHTRFYGCALCGVKFTGPHAVYCHLAKVHVTREGGRRLAPRARSVACAI